MNDVTSDIEKVIRKFVVFSINSDNYCLDVMLMREIRSWSGVTLLPDTPDHILGVVNLRGQIIPVVDMSFRLYGRPNASLPTKIVAIVEFLGKTIGLLVDEVTDIIDVSSDNIQMFPDLSNSVESRAIAGLTLHQDRTLSILSLDTIVQFDRGTTL